MRHVAWVPSSSKRKGVIDVGLVLLLLLLALLFGGAGLFVQGLKVLLLVAIVLAVASAFTGYRSYGRRP